MDDNYTHVESNVFYITENIMGPLEQSDEYETLFNDYNSQFIEHCTCNDHCSLISCECLQKSNDYKEIGIEWMEDWKYKLLNKVKSSYFVMECNDNCRCLSECGNRVVQRGPIKSLAIRSCDKGFGLFATCFIPSGSFICEYAGEIITTNQASIRHNDNKRHKKRNYIFYLREQIASSKPIITIVDPSIFGNIGRYINHSCEPNCHVIPVRCGTPIPKLAIFAHRNILPNEEVTFHYGLNDNINSDTASDRTKCLCNTKNCSGFMPFQTY